MSFTTTAVVAAGAVVVIGTWSSEKSLTPRIFVGGTFLAIALALMEQASSVLAARFALLVFIVATFMYGPAIVYRAGLTKQLPASWGGPLS